LTLPVSERLLNDAIVESLPPASPVRDLHVKPVDGDRFAVRLRVGSSGVLPALTFSASIDRQAAFPDAPELVLRLETSGLLSLGLHALRLAKLPAGIRFEHDRVHVNLDTLLRARGLAPYVRYIQVFEVHTADGALVVSIRASIER
jgi:hypothetical protein